MIYGYARAATTAQGLDSQIQKLTEYGCTKIYQEYGSGNTVNQELQNMLSVLTDGDEVVVCSVDRLSRNIRNFSDLISTLETKGIKLTSL
jgi:DNA invertase Pin-like site-specific DNA recombinase